MKTVLLVVAMLLCLFSVTVQAEPNDVNTPVASDPNLIKAGDGFTVGVSARTDPGEGQGSTLVDIGYTYGVAQFYFAADVEKQKYFEAGAEFESRDIVEDKSVYGLSTLLLMFTPESYVVTGVAGFGLAMFDEEEPYTTKEDKNNLDWISISGVNVRFNEDKNLCLTGRLVTAMDGDSELRVGLRIKF